LSNILDLLATACRFQLQIGNPPACGRCLTRPMTFRGAFMVRRLIISAVVAATVLIVSQTETAQAQDRAFGQSWGSENSRVDLNRFYHYPYVYYPHNYWGNEYYRSADSMYYRYPAEMRVPVYNRSWYNAYPTPRRYHWGHHFITDVF
jgi:hypothetical protein